MNDKLNRIMRQLNDKDYMQTAIECIADDCVRRMNLDCSFSVTPPTEREFAYLNNKSSSAGFKPHYISDEKRSLIVAMKKRNPNMMLRDIATAVGVSISAVSKILRGAS